MSNTIKDWSWLRIFAALQATVVIVNFVLGSADAETSTFWLVAAILLWLIGEKKEDPLIVLSEYRNLQEAGFEGVIVMPKGDDKDE